MMVAGWMATVRVATRVCGVEPGSVCGLWQCGSDASGCKYPTGLPIVWPELAELTDEQANSPHYSYSNQVNL